MNAKIDPKVVMDLSIFQYMVDATVCNPSIQNLLEEFIEENEAWLLIGISNRDPFLCDSDVLGETTLRVQINT